MEHIPVLLSEVISTLNIKDKGLYIDATFGRGGYSRAILDANPTCIVIGIDKDPDAVKAGRELEKSHQGRFFIFHAPFSQLDEILEEAQKKLTHTLSKADGIVFDLGVSSVQLDQADRGFSFSKPAYLDMRMDNSQGKTAADVIAECDEKELADIFYIYGEEHHSRRIAKAIVAQRKNAPIQKTDELAQLVAQQIPGPKGKSKIHPATKVFQALRIYVNQELQEIQTALQKSLNLLNYQGRLLMVSFHSLEDRIVKQFFKNHSVKREHVSKYKEKTGQDVLSADIFFREITKKPIIANQDELNRNPRSRSAKLRAVEYIRQEMAGVA